MSYPPWSIFSLPANRRPHRERFQHETYPAIDRLWAGATLRRQVDPVFGVSGLVVHIAARSTSEEAVAMVKAGRASWHWIVPAFGEPQHGHFVWSVAPPARAARHLANAQRFPGFLDGRGQLNHCTLSVLVTAAPDHPGVSDWQLAITARIIRHAWSMFPNLRQVACRRAQDADDMGAPGLDAGALCAQVIDPPATDLPTLVARATPISLLERPKPAELALWAH